MTTDQKARWLRWLRWLAEDAGALPDVTQSKGGWYWKHPRCMADAAGPFGSEDEARLNALENLDLLMEDGR